MLKKKVTIENISSDIRKLTKVVENLAIMTQNGFNDANNESDKKLGGLKTELIDFKQETKGNFALVRQEISDFKRETKDNFIVLKQSSKDDIANISKMSREDMDAFGQDIIKLKRTQSELETTIKTGAKIKR